MKKKDVKRRFLKLFYCLGILLFIVGACGEQKQNNEDNPEERIQQVLQSGWGTYNTWNSLSYVHMPEGFEIAFDLKYQGKHFSGYLPRANFIEGQEWEIPKLKAMAHAYDGSYTKMQVDWRGVHVLIETATDGDDFVALITPDGEQKEVSHVVVRAGLVFNKTGSLVKTEETILGEFTNETISLFPVTNVEDDQVFASSLPAFVMSLDQLAAISTGSRRSLEQVKDIIQKQREAYTEYAGQYGQGRDEVYRAISTILAWNTIYEPVNDRVLSTVSRTWNVSRGGYGLFCWDNFFMAYLAAIDNKELAFANVIALLDDATEEGFVPNLSQGNGRKSWDRSQPPVGGIMVKEIYKQYPEKWFLDSVFDQLLTWNRWWMERRYHKGMLCWGSHNSMNPYNDEAHHNHLAAVLESGLDDSPMYDDVPYDPQTGLLLLHDVGLNGLYVADCEALSEMALELGRDEEAVELAERADMIREQLKTLWNEEKGIFMNRRTDNGEFVDRYSPTLFYALMANAATEEQAVRMVNEYFYSPDYFWGDYIMPSIARNDPAFPDQTYWRGAIWAPMNFLTYLSLRHYEQAGNAKQDLADKSLELFVKEWRRKNYIAENYSAYNGKADDPRLNSHPFYSWGALLGVISYIQEGHMPPVEKTIQEWVNK